jgi:hypothetical protein
MNSQVQQCIGKQEGVADEQRYTSDAANTSSFCVLHIRVTRSARMRYTVMTQHAQVAFLEYNKTQERELI